MRSYQQVMSVLRYDERIILWLSTHEPEALARACRALNHPETAEALIAGVTRKEAVLTHQECGCIIDQHRPECLAYRGEPRVTRAETERRDRGYGKRRRQSLTSRHERHEQKVTSCPLCNPKGWRPEDVAYPPGKGYYR